MKGQGTGVFADLHAANCRNVFSLACYRNDVSIKAVSALRVFIIEEARRDHRNLWGWGLSVQREGRGSPVGDVPGDVRC